MGHQGDIIQYLEGKGKGDPYGLRTVMSQESVVKTTAVTISSSPAVKNAPGNNHQVQNRRGYLWAGRPCRFQYPVCPWDKVFHGFNREHRQPSLVNAGYRQINSLVMGKAPAYKRMGVDLAPE